MLKFFFNRFSKAVLLMELLGVVTCAMSAKMILIGESAILIKVLFSTILILYAFIRYCASVKWYKDAPRWSGIERQFKMSLAPASYILAIVGISSVTAPSSVLLALAAIFLLLIAHVGVILIYLHLKDKDKTPVNFYSGANAGRHLIDDAT